MDRNVKPGSGVSSHPDSSASLGADGNETDIMTLFNYRQIWAMGNRSRKQLADWGHLVGRKVSETYSST